MISEKSVWKGKSLTKYFIKTSSYKKYNDITQVSAICFDDKGRILLVKNPEKDYWVLPGGTPEKDERFEETLIREVDEESSCDIKILCLIGVIKVNFPDNPNKKEGENFNQLIFVAKIEKIKKIKKDPATNLIWERIFIYSEDFFKYIKWTDKIGKEVLTLAKDIFYKNER